MSPAARPSLDPAPRYLLVDGHSVLHAWPDLRAQHATRPAFARQELIRLLATLHDTGRWRVTLVFDGQAGGKEVATKDSLAVLYAPAGQTADSIIERIAQAHAGKGEIGVVTADHAEMTAVESLGAFGFSPDWLRDELRVAGEELTESIAQYRKRNSHEFAVSPITQQQNRQITLGNRPERRMSTPATYMTIAGKLSLGGSVGLSLATAALAFMVMTKKTQFANQLLAVETSLTSGKFTALGLPYTGNFMENEAEPAATISSAGEKWGVTSEDLKLAKVSEEKAKGELTEAQAKNQELSLTADKLTKDLTTTKTDLESTNSKLTLTSEQLQAYTDELKGKKPAELFTELNDLSEKMKVSESENKILNSAKEKLDLELKKLRTEVEMTRPGSAKSISLSGKIVAVNPTWNFVILDLGKNDQVVEGLTMVIYRGEKMIGKIKTVTVDAQTSVADVLPGTPASALEVGDQVVY